MCGQHLDGLLQILQVPAGQVSDQLQPRTVREEGGEGGGGESEPGLGESGALQVGDYHRDTVMGGNV